jgi:hypothetical protein
VTAASSGRRPSTDLHVLSDEPSEHHLHVGRDQVEVEQRRLDDLLPAERQQTGASARRHETPAIWISSMSAWADRPARTSVQQQVRNIPRITVRTGC